MAIYENVKTINIEAGEDFAAGSLHEAVAISTASATAGKLLKCDFDATDLGTRQPVGILAVDKADAGTMCTVVDIDGGGIGKCKAGAAITAGQVLIPHTVPGRVTGVTGIGTIAADQAVIGVALEAASAAGVIFSAKLGRMTGPHSA